jgi:hypothetical protein
MKRAVSLPSIVFIEQPLLYILSLPPANCTRYNIPGLPGDRGASHGIGIQCAGAARVQIKRLPPVFVRDLPDSGGREWPPFPSANPDADCHLHEKVMSKSHERMPRLFETKVIRDIFNSYAGADWVLPARATGQGSNPTPRPCR